MVCFLVLLGLEFVCCVLAFCFTGFVAFGLLVLFRVVVFVYVAVTDLVVNLVMVGLYSWWFWAQGCFVVNFLVGWLGVVDLVCFRVVLSGLRLCCEMAGLVMMVVLDWSCCCYFGWFAVVGVFGFLLFVGVRVYCCG